MVLALCLLPMGVGAQGLSALFGYSTFYLPEDNRPYAEIYLDFDASTLLFNADAADGQYRATVEITLVVRNGDSITYWKKYDLNSPAVSNPQQTNFTFLDLHRFYIDNGIYNLEMTLRDKHSDASPVVYRDKMVVYYAQGNTAMSPVQLMSRVTPTEKENVLTRAGMDMLPYVNDFVPAAMDKLALYFEIYNLDKEIGGQSFDIATYIRQRENGVRVKGFETIRHHSAPAQNQPVLQYLDIANLPSGNYELVIDIRDRAGESLMNSQVAFQRSNPGVRNDSRTVDVATSFAALITDEKLLNYYLKALYPISNDAEINAVEGLVKVSDLEAKQSFLYEFWVNRSELDPAQRWEEYKGWLEYVDANFSYPRTPGYRTDRGRVYLQYGPPDFVRDEKNFVGALRVGSGSSGQLRISGEGPDSRGHIYYLPYQLWRYNLLEGNDPNRVFLFWDELRSGYYKLLNSNAKGELIDPYWEHRLSQGQLDDDVVGEVGEQFNRGF